MAEAALVVNGRRYGGWKSVRVARSIETVAGSFDLEVTDRWAGQSQPWAIGEEDACRVEIDGQPVIDGHVDRRSISLTGEDRTLTYSGRDRAAVLADCSADLEKWTFRGVSALDVARKVAEPFGVAVSLAAGVTLPAPPRKFVVTPGDGALDVIERAAKMAGVMLMSDGAGGLLLTRSGAARAAPLVLGDNIVAAHVDYDAAQRHRRYLVVTQVGGTDGASGGATRIRGEATDAEIRRTGRVVIIRPDDGVTADYARARADWEARVRAARAEVVSIVVLGWTQPSGEVWPINALVPVRAAAIGVDGDLLIVGAENSISWSGKITQLRLVRPDAFAPEPRAVVKASSGGGGAWKELAGGAR